MGWSAGARSSAFDATTGRARGSAPRARSGRAPTARSEGRMGMTVGARSFSPGAPNYGESMELCTQGRVQGELRRRAREGGWVGWWAGG